MFDLAAALPLNDSVSDAECRQSEKEEMKWREAEVDREEKVSAEVHRAVMALRGDSSPAWFPSGKVAPLAGFPGVMPGPYQSGLCLVHKPYDSL